MTVLVELLGPLPFETTAIRAELRPLGGLSRKVEFIRVPCDWFDWHVERYGCTPPPYHGVPIERAEPLKPPILNLG